MKGKSLPEIDAAKQGNPAWKNADEKLRIAERMLEDAEKKSALFRKAFFEITCLVPSNGSPLGYKIDFSELWKGYCAFSGKSFKNEDLLSSGTHYSLIFLTRKLLNESTEISSTSL